MRNWKSPLCIECWRPISVGLWPKAIASVLAFLAMPCDVSSQPEFEIAPNDTQQEAIGTIQEIELRDGPNSADLIEPLTALGLYYEVEGDQIAALAAFQRAREVVRINYGFQTVQEALVIQRLVSAEEARGNVEAAWSLEQELLDLVWPSHDTRGSEEYPSDLQAVPILDEIADRRMEVLDRYRAGEFPPQIVLGCYYDRAYREHCTSGSRSQMTNAIAAEANWYRAAAIRDILVNERYSSNELRELELKSLSSGRNWSICPDMTVQELLEIELVDSCLDPIIRRRRTATTPGAVFANVGGEAALMRLLIYEVRSGAPTLRQVDALVRLADWQIRYPFALGSGSSRYGNSALELYEYAYRLLRENADSPEIANQLFSPETPVVLETFFADQLSFEEVSAFSGYIDVAFDITKFGHAVAIEVLGATANVSRKSKRDLIRLIDHSAFRPRLTEGEFADTSRVVARYYSND